MGTVSEVEVRSLSQEPGPSGCFPSLAKGPPPSGSPQGGREGEEEGDSWRWGQGEGGKGPSPKATFILKLGCFHSLQTGVPCGENHSAPATSRGSTAGESTELELHVVQILTIPLLGCVTWGALPALSESFIHKIHLIEFLWKVEVT